MSAAARSAAAGPIASRGRDRGGMGTALPATLEASTPQALGAHNRGAAAAALSRCACRCGRRRCCYCTAAAAAATAGGGGGGDVGKPRLGQRVGPHLQEGRGVDNHTSRTHQHPTAPRAPAVPGRGGRDEGGGMGVAAGHISTCTSHPSPHTCPPTLKSLNSATWVVLAE